MSEKPIPLCVDLDGTLVRTDTLHEALLELVKRYPLGLLKAPFWLSKGKHVLKQKISERVSIDATSLPYRNSVIELIKSAKAVERPVILVTASTRVTANAVADHLGLFDDVMTSDAGINLSSHNKANKLVEAFRERGFDYVGNGKDDIAVWQKAREAIIISNDKSLAKKISIPGQIIKQIIEPSSPSISNWFKCLRPHQWLKNILVFAPLLAGQKANNINLLIDALLAFFAFSAAASAVYVVNDLLDLRSDRLHPRKHKRPFASGALPVSAGLVATPLLILCAIFFSTFMPPIFLGVLACYFICTTIYSVWLKQRVLVDVMLLSCLYTFRIIAGSAATGITPSFWLLAFSMFIFLSLAIVKRHVELFHSNSKTGEISGRGYLATDLPVLLALGTGSGLISVLILALYIDSPIPHISYNEPIWLWLYPPFALYWVCRLWLKTHRGEVHDDPVVFAIRDRQSQIIAIFLCIFGYAAIYGTGLH